jgi:hypothetical protein
MLIACASVASVAQTEEPQLSPQPGILVLRTGRVLRGEIARVGDRYVVALGEHDEVGVPLDAVEMQCPSLEDAYRRKRDQLPPAGKVADHLRLADWCLRYDLLACAAEQLMAAQQCDPADPENAIFEKRLTLAAQRPATLSSESKSVVRTIIPPNTDEIVGDLPAGTVEQFTTVIQPLLINRCGSASCHGPNSHSSFRLTYPNWSRTLPRRFTQRNLQAVLALLDRAQPQRSPLLTMATAVHGNLSKPALTDDDTTQLSHLAEWIHLSLGNASPEPPAALNSPDSLLLQPGARQPGMSAATAADRATKPQPPATTESPERVDNRVQKASHVSPVDPAAGSLPGGSDPFDPEIFNRRFGKKVR